MAAIMQRFTKTRLGWRVTTQRADEGMGAEPGLFAFTLGGAQRRGARAARKLTRSAPDFTVRYDERGRVLPPAPPPPPRKSDGLVPRT